MKKQDNISRIADWFDHLSEKDQQRIGYSAIVAAISLLLVFIASIVAVVLNFFT